MGTKQVIVELRVALGVYFPGDYANVYRGSVAGGAVSYSSPLNAVPIDLYRDIPPVGGWLNAPWLGEAWLVGRPEEDEFTIQFPAGPLGAGTWTFGTKAFDAAGNASSATEHSIAVTSTPGRVTLSKGAYVEATDLLTLSWTAAF